MSPNAAIAIAAIWLSAGLTGFFTTSQLNLALASLCAFAGTFLVTERDR